MLNTETTMKLRSFLSACMLAVLAIAASGCSTAPKQAYMVVAPATVPADGVIPQPRSAPVLTLSGMIGTNNVGSTLSFDMSTIEHLRMVSYSIDDPWRGARTDYTGVLVSDLLKAAAVPATATSLHMTALDDYEVDLPIDFVEKYPVLLATRADDGYMLVEDGGPTRIIFPYDSYPDLNVEQTKDQLIWSIKTLEVR
jgi:hypothetical protein